MFQQWNEPYGRRDLYPLEFKMIEQKNHLKIMVLYSPAGVCGFVSGAMRAVSNGEEAFGKEKNDARSRGHMPSLRKLSQLRKGILW